MLQKDLILRGDTQYLHTQRLQSRSVPVWMSVKPEVPSGCLFLYTEFLIEKGVLMEQVLVMLSFVLQTSTGQIPEAKPKFLASY